MFAVWTSWHDDIITTYQHKHSDIRKKMDLFIVSLNQCSHHQRKRLGLYVVMSLVWTRPNLHVAYAVLFLFSYHSKMIFTRVQEISRELNIVVRPNIISIWCKSQHLGLFETWASSNWIHLNTILLKPSCCGYYVGLSRAWYLRRCNYYQKNLQWNKYSITFGNVSVLTLHFCPNSPRVMGPIGPHFKVIIK